MSDTMAVLVAAKISRPAVIKSDVDEIVQDGHDNGVEMSLEKYRVAEHLSAMHKAGHSKASAAPQRANSSSSGNF
ncbi:hypothetical protein ACFONL_11445 [Camelimonas fluminis]|uniref:Uncharacterized protein n=1 Tax=Camelimonas fluminis TaxID=1576911 RepID=A0ABV7UI44_9HYPH|nr:hypothetical protein [Camelimonas fluminis]